MTYDDQEIMRRHRLGEDSAWEFKQIEFNGDRPTSPRRDDLADEIAAFANASGGVLLCGITDDGAVQGLSRRQLANLDALLVEISADSIRPPVRIRTDHRELAGGKPALLVEVPAGHSLHESPGGSFIRVGASKRRLTGDERLRLAQPRGQARFRCFDEQPVPDTGFRTLDDELWKLFLSAEGAADPESALIKLGLLAPDDTGVTRATVSGLLLCSRNPQRWLPNAVITATRYRGDDRASGQIDAQNIAGPLGRQIADAVTFAIRNMQVAARKTPARLDLPQYSARALFEALVNAAAHRDYSMRGSKIRLSMFRSRLEIQSPGSLPNNLTVESMAARQATRNQTLTSLLGRLPVEGIRGSEDRLFFMERRGDGVPIIRRATRELCGRFPEYRLINDSELCLVIPAAPLPPGEARARVTVRRAGAPLQGVDLLLLFPNRTWRRARTGPDGAAVVDLSATHLPMTVFAAAAGYAAGLEYEWIPAQGDLSLELAPLPGGGAVIFRAAAGRIPGLLGELRPKRDAYDRAYLFASNMIIDQGRRQPVYFLLGEELRLTDAAGREMTARILEVAGQAALVEYRPFVKTH